MDKLELHAATLERIQAAKNPNTSLVALCELAKDDYWVRLEVARNPNISLGILREMATDEAYGVRRNVVRNPKTPENTIRELALDESDHVRWAVAENTMVSSNLLVMLFEYEKNLNYTVPEIIVALYKNTNSPLVIKKVIETLYGEWL